MNIQLWPGAYLVGREELVAYCGDSNSDGNSRD
jgi:hypothetical protein